MLHVFGVNGRINRLTWWIVQIGIFILGYLVNRFFFPSFPTNKTDIQLLLANPAAVKALSLQFVAVLPVFLISGIATHWLFISSTVQRLHDRGNSGWRVLFAYLPFLVLIASLANVVAKGSVATSLLGIAMCLAGYLLSFVWLIVECGIFASDDGINEYGVPPGTASRRAQLMDELEGMMGNTGLGGHETELVYQSSAPSVVSPVRPSFGRR
jgi:uncharacterized membrane protein YhaH (DUF805 family)